MRFHLKYFEGRLINDARHSKDKVNARFAADYATNPCSVTGHIWVRTKINSGDKIFINYGDDYWSKMERQVTRPTIIDPDKHSNENIISEGGTCTNPRTLP